MKQAISIRKCFTVIVALLFAVALVFTSQAIASRGALAEDTDYSGWHEALTITNSQFADTGSGDIPTPTNWTGAGIGGAPTASVKSGVMNLSTYGSNKDKYFLDQYDEYKNAQPDSPFGKGDSASGSGYYQDTNRNVLLINANGTPTAYGYTSASFTLAPNSYYVITAWVKTGSIGANGGAAILVNGLSEDPVGFTAINTQTLTSSDEKLLGWFDYTIYIETSSFLSSSATLSLQLGYNGVGGLNTKGYAMFDNITATQLSSKMFYEQTAGITDDANSRKKVFSFNESEYLTGGDFSVDGQFGTIVGSGYASKQYIDASNGLPSDNNLGLEKQLYAPTEYSDGANKVFAVSTFNKSTGKFGSAYAGIESNEFTLDRYSYYRISAWYNSESVEGGDGVTATLKYKSVKNTGEFTSNVTSSLSLSAENKNHNGWNELSIYVKGSDFTDYTAKLELSLGTKDNPSQGVALFDDVKIQRISPAEYNDNNSAGNKAVTIDTATDSSGINNGWFNTVGTYEELEYVVNGDGSKTLKNPLTPANWTMQSTSSVGTSGYSQTEVDTSEAVYGLVPVEEMGNFPALTKTWGNVLKMSSAENTAFCYASEDFTVATDSYNTVAVTLYADNLSGYGANLVLKKGGKVVATIEKITKSGTYTFYVKGGSADGTMTLELWLGLNDRINNETKLASGTVYFTGIEFKTDSTQEVFDAKAAEYKITRDIPSVREGISYAAVSLGAEDLTLFDSYDSSAVKYPYNWTITKGTGKVIYGITEETDKNGSYYAMMLQNVEATYSELTLDNSFTLSADSYYKLTVSVKADIPEEYRTNEKAVGAFVKLTNGDYKFEFKDTSVTTDSITDNDVYRTYTFYIKAPAAETNASIVLGLGGKDKTNQAIAGKVYLKDIVLEDISNIDYDEITADLAEDDNLIDEYTMRADLAASDTTDDTTDNTTDEDTTQDTTDTNVNNGGLEWWLIPSILLAVAVIIAIVGSFIRKRIESRPKKVNVAKQSTYDRRLMKTEDIKAEAAKKADADVKDTFESFDDTVTELGAEKVTETAKTESAEVKTADTEKAEEGIEKAEAATKEKAAETAEAAGTAETTEANEAAAEEKATEAADVKEGETAKPKTEEKKKDAKSADEFVDDFED